MNEPAAEGTEAQDAPKVLRRSTTDRMIGGVAGGLGRYLGVDPVLLRIAFVLLAVFGGSGLLLYVIGWILIPEERPGDHVGEPPASSASVSTVVGIVLVALGGILLVRELVPDAGRFVAPLILIVLGGALLVGMRR